jgi:hypothetical protein
VDGWDLLFKAQERRKDHEGQKETLAMLCRLRVTAGELEAAAADYEMYKNLGGEKLPRGVWLELCRYFEREQRWELAVDEYEKLAHAFPAERAALPILAAPRALKNASKKRNCLRFPIPISTPRFKKGCRNASRLPFSRCATCAKISAAVACNPRATRRNLKFQLQSF